MAVKLTNKTNTEGATAENPYGKAKDNTGSNDGTPADVQLFHDALITFEKAMDEAGLTHNGIEDNEYDGFQYYEALRKCFRPYNVYTAFISQAGTAAPTATILDQWGIPAGDITFSRSGVGIYSILSASGIFTANKTAVFVGSTGNVTSEIRQTPFDTSTYSLFTYSSGVLADDVLLLDELEIRIYD